MKESCWHQCPHCRKDWCHSVNGTAPPDSYFTPCASCQVTHIFDAVEHAMKRDRSVRKAATEECEEFTLALPTRREEEA
jgi:hypothetical protein